MFGRPPTSSGVNRLQTASAKYSNLLQNNSSDLQQAANDSQQRPGTSTMFNPTGRLATGIAAPRLQTGIAKLGTSRPITASGHNQRQVQDQSYWTNELLQRISNIQNEINRLTAASIVPAYSNTLPARLHDLQNEVRELQGKLGDFNLLADKLHTGGDLNQISTAQHAMQLSNQSLSQAVSELLAVKQHKEDEVKAIMKTLEQFEKQSESLPPSLRQQYQEAKDQNQQLQAEMEQLQIELDQLTPQLISLQDKAKESAEMTKVYELTKQLKSLQSKYSEMAPEQVEDRETMMKNIREDSEQIKTMERKITELEEFNRRGEEQLAQMHSTIQQFQEEKNEKFEELVKRDEEMKLFFATYDGERQDLIGKMSSTQQEINSLLGRLAEHKRQSLHRPADQIIKDVESKRQEQEKLQQFEANIRQELVEINNRVSLYEESLSKFSNLDGIKQQALAEKQNAQAEKEALIKHRGLLRQTIHTTQQSIETVQKSLNDKETYSQLNALQSRLSHLASTHFQLKREVNQKTVESDVAGMMREVQSLADSYNSLLIKLSSLPTMTKRYTNM